MHPMFDRLVALLDARSASYRVLMHDAEGQSARVAEIRGTEPGQGAKAMLCSLKGQAGPYALVILPGDQKLDMKKVGAALGGKKSRAGEGRNRHGTDRVPDRRHPSFCFR